MPEVRGLQVDFDIEVKKGDETKKFHIVCESAERFDKMRAYNGYDMDLTRGLVNNSEEDELYDFLDCYLDFEEISNILIKEAEKEAKWYV